MAPINGNGDRSLQGEEAKNAERGGNAAGRGDRLWGDGHTDESRALIEQMRAAFFGPSIPMPIGNNDDQIAGWMNAVAGKQRSWAAHVHQARPNTRHFLRRSDVGIIIPMFEQDEEGLGIPGPTVRGLLHAGMAPEQIVLVNHFSADHCVQTARDCGVVVVPADQMLACFSPRLTDILGGHQLKLGKGVAVMLGAIALESMQRQHMLTPLEWSYWIDSEITGLASADNPDGYDPLHYLAYPAVSTKHPDRYDMILQTHCHRNNEVVHGTFGLMDILADLLPEDRAKLVRDVQMRLRRMTHPCAGERLLRWSAFERCPFGHHYTIEHVLNWTICCMGYERGVPNVAQILNPANRLDASNSIDSWRTAAWTEQKMMYAIARMYTLLASLGVPLHHANLEMLGSLNARIARQTKAMTILPPTPHHPWVQPFALDRLIPSVRQLVDHELVDMARIAQIVRQAQP